MRIVAIDIGGTHVRFAVAEVGAGRVVSLGDAVTLKTAEHVSLASAWAMFAHGRSEPLPRAAAIAVAAPVSASDIRLTNNSWTIRPGAIGDALGVERHLLINDFAAVGHAVAQAGAEHFTHLCGPEPLLPDEGRISIVGPGTGLGVAHIRREGDRYDVQPTEGGHMDFAPLDAFEDRLLARLRERHRRVSIERVVSGPGLVAIHETLGLIEGTAFAPTGDAQLWQRGLSGGDRLADAAIERFCLSLGSVAGDLVLAQGGAALVIAGGLGLRIRDRLITSGFASRFRAKGRFEALMNAIPVSIITHPQPGLFGAAAAFAQQYRR